MTEEHGVDEAGGNDEEPEVDLPDAPLFGLFRIIETEVGAERTDRVWIFPPRRLEAGTTAVVVVAAFLEVDSDRRRVFAAHYTDPADETDARLTLDEFGTAPADRVGRVVEDVVVRLKDEPAAPPRTARIEGDQTRWNELLHQLAEQHLDETVARHPHTAGPRSLATGTRKDRRTPG